MESRADKLSSLTKEQQFKLAAFSKTGSPQDGLQLSKPQNLSQYRRLVFNVTFEILSTAYPISRKLLDTRWKSLVEQFMEGHNCSNNQVWKMPMEFYQFVKEQPLELKLELPFLTDLLWFEWLEIELYSEEDIPVDNFRKDGNWRNNTVVLNPHYRTVCFEYPVFRPQVNLEHCERGSYYLLLLRNLKDYKVKFLEISELFYATLQQNPQNFKESLLQVAKSRFGIQDEELVLKKAQPTVELFFQKGLFLGFN